MVMIPEGGKKRLLKRPVKEREKNKEGNQSPLGVREEAHGESVRFVFGAIGGGGKTNT